MSGMIIHLDEIGEKESRISLTVVADVEKMNVLLEPSDYRALSGLRAELDINVVGDTLRIVGELDIELGFHCGRCLEARRRPLTFDAEFVLVPRAIWAARYEVEDEVELSDDDMDVSFYEGEEIDLRPLIREAILLELPTLPRCSDDEREQCDQAYRANVGAAALKQLDEASIDLRWSALKDIKLKE